MINVLQEGWNARVGIAQLARRREAMKIDYDVPCRCEHMPVNHTAALGAKGAIWRGACLLCDCQAYKPRVPGRREAKP